MKHLHRNRILSRAAKSRGQLLQNLTSALLTHGSIVTTEAKAKELRRHVEPLVTKAKGELTLHRRRYLLQHLMHAEDLSRLLAVAKTNKNRPGGYIRLTRLPSRRADAASVMRVDFVDQPTL
jgi:large subunit ribosomal protein L17